MTEHIFRHRESSEYWFHEGCHILEIANHTGDPDVSIARARVAPGRTTRWHSLAGVTERYLLISGEGRVEIGDQAGQDVGPGDLVFIPANSRQRICNTGENDLVFYAICSPRFTPDCYREDDEAGGQA